MLPAAQAGAVSKSETTEGLAKNEADSRVIGLPSRDPQTDIVKAAVEVAGSMEIRDGNRNDQKTGGAPIGRSSGGRADDGSGRPCSRRRDSAGGRR